ncbi:MAG: hypothetical protein HRU17_08550 [Polyangiaceae bacterium]|nr:hypothetical protein [Polyangiaceae bacterium]
MTELRDAQDSFQCGLLTAVYMLGAREHELSKVLTQSQRSEVARRLLRGLSAEGREARAKALAPELARLLQSTEARRIR